MTELITYAVPVALGAAALAAPLFIGAAAKWRRFATDDAGKWFEDERMPAMLRNAVLYMNEKSISMAKPVHLEGRVDQVYLLESGMLMPVDTKTRDRHVVYDSDIMQLSMYAMILAYTTNRTVCDAGFVRTVIRTEQSRDVRYHFVRLLPESAIVQAMNKP